MDRGLSQLSTQEETGVNGQEKHENIPNLIALGKGKLKHNETPRSTHQIGENLTTPQSQALGDHRAGDLSPTAGEREVVTTIFRDPFVFFSSYYGAVHT